MPPAVNTRPDARWRSSSSADVVTVTRWPAAGVRPPTTIVGVLAVLTCNHRAVRGDEEVGRHAEVIFRGSQAAGE